MSVGCYLPIVGKSIDGITNQSRELLFCKKKTLFFCRKHENTYLCNVLLMKYRHFRSFFQSNHHLVKKIKEPTVFPLFDGNAIEHVWSVRLCAQTTP